MPSSTSGGSPADTRTAESAVSITAMQAQLAGEESAMPTLADLRADVERLKKQVALLLALMEVEGDDWEL